MAIVLFLQWIPARMAARSWWRLTQPWTDEVAAAAEVHDAAAAVAAAVPAEDALERGGRKREARVPRTGRQILTQGGNQMPVIDISTRRCVCLIPEGSNIHRQEHGIAPGRRNHCLCSNSEGIVRCSLPPGGIKGAGLSLARITAQRSV